MTSRRGALRLGLGAIGALGFTVCGAAAAEVLNPAELGGRNPTGRARAARQAKSRLEAFVEATGGRMSVAVLDRISGARLASGTKRFATASIVKVDILAALLLSDATLTGSRRDLATSMITVSDNDAASRLFDVIGGVRGLTAANRVLGLRETAPAAAWGETTTTAADQIRLLAAITNGKGPLSEPARRLVLELMRDVVDEQSWGVSAAAKPPGSGVWVKNGWVPVGDDAGRWIVNSIGRIVEKGHDWLVAVLSDHHPSQDKGIAAVENAAQLAVAELRR